MLSAEFDNVPLKSPTIRDRGIFRLQCRGILGHDEISAGRNDCSVRDRVGDAVANFHPERSTGRGALVVELDPFFRHFRERNRRRYDRCHEELGSHHDIGRPGNLMHLNRQSVRSDDKGGFRNHDRTNVRCFDST